MATYKSILKGTVNAIGAKAKDLIENGAVREAYDKGTTAAKSYANIAMLTLKINGELEEEKEVFAEIGRLYYEQSGGVASGDYAPLYEKLWEIEQKIDSMRAELSAAKSAVDELKASRGVEVEIVDYPPEE